MEAEALAPDIIDDPLPGPRVASPPPPTPRPHHAGTSDTPDSRATTTIGSPAPKHISISHTPGSQATTAMGSPATKDDATPKAASSATYFPDQTPSSEAEALRANPPHGSNDNPRVASPVHSPVHNAALETPFSQAETPTASSPLNSNDNSLVAPPIKSETPFSQAETPLSASDVEAPQIVNIRVPAALSPGSPPRTSTGHPFQPFPHEWLIGKTWNVSNSTLSMWSGAQNVRITYSSHPDFPDDPRYNHDMVEYEKRNFFSESVKSIKGTNSPREDSEAAWNWRGRGLLKFVTSQWEVLGWGARPLPQGQKEKWIVTWFSKTWFTSEGIDIYTDQWQGLSSETYNMIMKELLDKVPEKKVNDLAKSMMKVETRLP